MGVREKTEFNLQTACLVTAVAFLLFFIASWNYTTGWRERRIFRRRLADTQRRLTTKDKEDKEDSRHRRRQWKRFVAAAPLVPLATAYVAARLGWDVFELLVFCAIDGARHVSAQSLGALVVAWAEFRVALARVLRRMDAWRRLQLMVILSVEWTVVWAFHSLFPAVSRGLSRVADGAGAAARWWERVDGAGRLRDGVEALVLDWVVPGFGILMAACRRLAWLAGRATEAAVILGADLIRDLRILARWAGIAAHWLAADARWWRNPEVYLQARRVLSLCIAQVRSFTELHVAPLLGEALRIMRALAVRLAALGWLASDALMQYSLGVAVRAGRHVTPLTRTLWGWTAYAHAVLPLAARGLQTAFGHVRLAAHMLTSGLAMAVVLGADAHAWAVTWILLPGAHVVALAAVRGGTAMRIGSAWMGRTVIWPFVALLGDVGRTAETACEELVTFVSSVHVEWLRVSVDLSWAAELAAQIAAALGAKLLAVLSVLAGGWEHWWRDAMRAMTDVVARLVVVVDKAVMLVGDLVVEYARQSTVHGIQNPK
ncbi:hypothetical protein GGI20_005259 [Coemansia sp. BCRC 34301]|nr:hypothetical protein GGI20_005259 [Coemansia sp. BCRC 34301]